MAYTDKLTKALMGGKLKTEAVQPTTPERPKIHSNFSEGRQSDKNLTNALLDGLMAPKKTDEK